MPRPLYLLVWGQAMWEGVKVQNCCAFNSGSASSRHHALMHSVDTHKNNAWTCALLWCQKLAIVLRKKKIRYLIWMLRLLLFLSCNILVNLISFLMPLSPQSNDPWSFSFFIYLDTTPCILHGFENVCHWWFDFSCHKFLITVYLSYGIQ